MKLLPLLTTICLFLVMCDTTNSAPDQKDDIINFSITGSLSNDANSSLNITIKTDGPTFSTDGNYSAGKENLIKTHFAIWIEDANGNYIKTLKINSGTAKAKITTDTITNISDTTNKLTSLPTWESKSKATTTFTGELNSDKIFIELDGVTAASLACHNNTEATVTATWDFTDASDNLIAAGTYKYYAEVSALLKLIDKEKSTADTTVYQESQYPSYIKTGTFEYSGQ